MMREIEKIQSLIGPVTEHDIRHIDAFYCDTMGLFIPSLGQCEYAISEDHVHPTYMLVILRDLFRNVTSLPEIPFKGSGDYIAAAISPGIPHTETESEDFTRYHALCIHPALFETVWRTYEPEGPPPLRWDIWKIDPGIQDHLRDFMAEFENDLPGKEPIMQAIGVRIAHHVLRSRFRLSVNTERITRRTEVAKALEFMHLKYAEKLTVNDVAKSANMSVSHFSRTFKTEIGMPPLEKLIEIRLSKARQMLDNTARSISQVAVDCGFATPSHFSTAFSRSFGVSPSQYRNRTGL